MPFPSDFRWAQRWIPALKRFIGPHLLRPGTLEEDRLQGTDLIVLTAHRARIACRVRRPGYAVNGWEREITLTVWRESGAPCEFDKIVSGGWGDFFCYAHATRELPGAGGVLQPIVMLDLALLRPFLLAYTPIVEAQPNKDPVGERCFFRAYRLDTIVSYCGRGVIVAREP